MANKLTLRIITPDRVVLEQQVDKVVATAIDGELCVLPEHEPLITALGIDVVRYNSGGDDHTAAVMGGVCEVANNEVIVLSDLAELDTEIDEARAKHDKERAEAERIQKTDKLEVYLTEMAISRAMARLKAVEYMRARSRRGVTV